MTFSSPILVTGVAGFIGSHVADRLLSLGRQVVGLDCFSPYHDRPLQQARLLRLQGRPGYRFETVDIADMAALQGCFSKHRPGSVVHLAAQAGVRHSIEHPQAFVSANLTGFGNLLECCRQHAIGHLVFASSSSVYGDSAAVPFSVHDPVNHPVSFYAATKRANELMAHSYAHLFGLPVTGLRFFTVYGPWGRPDMSYFLFTRAILAGEPVRLFGGGHLKRDFTYIDDVVEATVRLLDRPAVASPSWDPAAPDPATARAPFRLHNIGNRSPIAVSQLVDILERVIGRPAVRDFQPMQPGDVTQTFADIDSLACETGFAPKTTLEQGIARFVAWYRDYHKV